MILMAVAVGVVAGLAATLYRLALHTSFRFFFSSGPLSASPNRIDHLLACGLPVLGGLIVGWVAYRALRSRGGHGVPSVMKAVVTGKVNLPPSMAARSALSVITMASGASAGPEGPIVEIGAVAGSSVGRLARVTRERMGALVGCGAAAGIAAMFNAPLGGVLFALELILRDFTIPRFTPVVIAAVVASVVTQVLLPHQPVFSIAPGLVPVITPGFSHIFAFAGLGLLCAIFSALYISAIYRAQDFFQRAVRLPTWLKPALGGVLVGLVALFFPLVQGEGYGFLNELLFQNTNLETKFAVALLFFSLAKILATAITLGSGFVGGSFAPAMFIGATLGGAFGVFANHFAPGAFPPPAVFALVGMAGVVAGSLSAPMSAIILIYEISGGSYHMLFPLMICVATAAALTRRLRPGSVYTLSLLRDGFDVEAATQRRDPLAGLTARDAMVRETHAIPENATLNEILDAVSESEAPAFCVLDGEKRLRGLISVNNLRAVLALGEEMGPLLIASEIADPNPACLWLNSPLTEALEIFSRSDAEAIPVLESEAGRRVAGMIYRRHLLRLYRPGQSAEGAGL